MVERCWCLSAIGNIGQPVDQTRLQQLQVVIHLHDVIHKLAEGPPSMGPWSENLMKVRGLEGPSASANQNGTHFFPAFFQMQWVTSWRQSLLDGVFFHLFGIRFGFLFDLFGCLGFLFGILWLRWLFFFCQRRILTLLGRAWCCWCDFSIILWIADVTFLWKLQKTSVRVKSINKISNCVFAWPQLATNLARARDWKWIWLSWVSGVF